MRTLLILLLSICSTLVAAQEVKQVNYAQLEDLMKPKDEVIHVINFWATWCKPCVEELPYFENLGVSHKDKNVKIILVSLDFINQIDSKLIPFIKKHQIKSEVVVLNASNENVWIPKISPDWSGSIPATLIIKGNKRLFFEKSFTEESLYKTIKQFL